MTKHTSEPIDWRKVERPYEPHNESEDPEQWCRVLAWEEAHSAAKDARIAELEAKLAAEREKVELLREAHEKITLINNHEPDCNQSGELLDARGISRQAIATIKGVVMLGL